MHFVTVDAWRQPNRVYTLTNALTAFTIFPSELDAPRLGPLCELPEQAELEICGDGFNERTVKARYGDSYYFVFWSDLNSASCSGQAAVEDDQWLFPKPPNQTFRLSSDCCRTRSSLPQPSFATKAS
jgi:hypothetical protein